MKLSIATRFVIIHAASVLVAACMPWPHRHYFAPAAQGVVLNNGLPVADATVRLSAEFAKDSPEVVTDATGHFKLDPLREWRIIAPLLGDPLYGFTVTISAQGGEYVGFKEYGVGYASSRINLACDLGHSTGPVKQPQFCAKSGE